MDPAAPFASTGPQPPSSAPHSYFPPQPSARPQPPPSPQDSGFASQGGPQVPVRPASAGDRPRPAAQAWAPAAQGMGHVDIRNVRASCLFGFREYVTLRRKRQRLDGSAAALEVESRLRAQANLVVGDIRTLQFEVRGLAKAAENQRWRRWLLGTIIAAFVPAIRRIFRRGSDAHSHESTNNTEHAFWKAKGLMARIHDGVLGSGRLAQVACVVFAVLYVFQNEVTIRVARTMQRRLKKLSERVERGDADLDVADIAVLEGWRWRILLW